VFCLAMLSSDAVTYASSQEGIYDLDYHDGYISPCESEGWKHVLTVKEDDGITIMYYIIDSD
jgi:hypothetical protein